MTRISACLLGLSAIALAYGHDAHADNLFRNAQRANIASDLKSLAPGQILTVIVVQRAEARNSQDNLARREQSLSGSLSSDAITQTGELSLEGGFSGRGEIRRSESFFTQISVTIESVAPNGDLVVAGEQRLTVNGESTLIRVRGRVRPEDVSAENQVLSTRLADAEIDYSGKGFVSRNASSGPLGWLLSMLGLGG